MGHDYSEKDGMMDALEHEVSSSKVENLLPAHTYMQTTHLISAQTAIVDE